MESAPARIEGGSPSAKAAAMQRRIRTGAGAGHALARAGLRVLSWLYGAGASAKNLLFDLGLRRGAQSEARIISVGNLSAGGTGKTPLVAFLAGAAMEAGRNVAVLTRGYQHRGSTAEEGDEVKLLRRLVPGIKIVIDADRVRGAAECVEDGVDLILLDDGFQHRRLRRDVDVVLLDAQDPLAGGLLPLGLLREPPRGLRRASLLILTRCERAGEARVQEVRRELSRLAPDIPVLTEDHAAVALVTTGDTQASISTLTGAAVLAFSGIGDPKTLSESLTALGADVRASIDFGDHHEYTSADRRKIFDRAREVSATQVVTTEKDLMRLGDNPTSDRHPPILALRITAHLRTPAERDRLSNTVGFPIPTPKNDKPPDPPPQ